MQIKIKNVRSFSKIFSFVFVSIIFCIGWTYFAGKDLNWDSLNYHYYVAYQWVENRVDKDFLASSIQSYLNPIAYLPFYWMVQADFNSFTISGALAAFHALNLVAVGWIASMFIPSNQPLRKTVIALAVILALINPIFLIEVGTTFNDVSTSVLVLASYSFCILWLRQESSESHIEGPVGIRSSLAVAGVLIGAATGLKLTNAIFYLGLLPFVLISAARIKSLLFLSACALLGFLITNGAWAIKLWETFKNPFFPYFNKIFASPDFPFFSIRNYRFVPDNFWDALEFPLNALKNRSDIYTETVAPDGRFLLTIIFIFALFFIPKIRRLVSRSAADSINYRMMLALCSSWVIVYCAWLYSSGNGRYFLPFSLMMGVILAVGTYRLIGANRFSIYALGLICVLQLSQAVLGFQVRWSPSNWSRHWFELEVPTRLSRIPAFFLTPSSQSAMFVAPSLHRDAQFSNISGQVSIPSESGGGLRLSAMIAKNGSPRSLYPVLYSDPEGQPLERAYYMYDSIFERFGLKTNKGNCELIKFNFGSRTDVNFDSVANSVQPKASLLSCALSPINHNTSSKFSPALQAEIEAAFDKVEDACPRLFSPSRGVTEEILGVRLRRYVNSDITLATSVEGEFQYLYYSGGEAVSLGTINNPTKVDCAIKKLAPFGLVGFF